MVLRAPDRWLIGHIGFHQSPDARGALEMGYAVEPEHRRRGFASEAVRALLAWATRTHSVHHFVASVSSTNTASLRLIRQLGSRQTGRQVDEIDGLELVLSSRPAIGPVAASVASPPRAPSKRGSTMSMASNPNEATATISGLER